MQTARRRAALGRRSRRGRSREKSRSGTLDVRADLTIAADGRESGMRVAAPVSRRSNSARRWTCSGCGSRSTTSDPHETFGYIRGGRIMALIDRGSYWQCAYVIPKDTLAELRDARLGSVPARGRARSSRSCTIASHEIASWDDVKLLTVRVNRLQRMVSARAALHRRRRARHVADRRRRHQPGDSRRRGGGQHARAEKLTTGGA